MTAVLIFTYYSFRFFILFLFFYCYCVRSKSVIILTRQHRTNQYFYEKIKNNKRISSHHFGVFTGEGDKIHIVPFVKVYVWLFWLFFRPLLAFLLFITNAKNITRILSNIEYYPVVIELNTNTSILKWLVTNNFDSFFFTIWLVNYIIFYRLMCTLLSSAYAEGRGVKIRYPLQNFRKIIKYDFINFTWFLSRSKINIILIL